MRVGYLILGVVLLVAGLAAVWRSVPLLFMGQTQMTILLAIGLACLWFAYRSFHRAGDVDAAPGPR